MTHSLSYKTAIFIMLTSALPASAQDGPTPDGWSVGAVAAISTNPYVGEDTDVVPYPSITYKNGPLSIGTLGIGYEIYQSDGLTFSAGIVPRFTGLFSTNAPELDGIDRKVTGDVALELGYDSGSGLRTGLKFRQEFTGEHDGQEVVWDIGYGTLLGNVAVEMSTGVAWQSKDLSAYIWGVSATEARVSRPEYAPGDVVIPYAAINALAPLSENWSLVGTIRADFLPSDVSDSPIVDRNSIYTVLLGVIYKF